MSEKKKLDELTKAKLIYSGELIIFSIAFLVLGFLKIFNVINLSKTTSWYRYVFVVVTLLGGIWFIFDFIWTLKSEKRRAKNPLIDKIILLPSSLATLIFDLRALIVGINSISDPIFNGTNTILNLYTSILFFYFSAVFLFQGIYHYKYPHPALLEEMKEEDKEDKKEDIEKQ